MIKLDISRVWSQACMCQLRGVADPSMPCIVMAYIIMAYIVMAYVVMGYVVMAYIVMALYSYGL